jgi:hypothetical protein
MTTTSRTFSHRCRAWSALAGLAGLFRTLAGGLGDHYRPELHYMRGPGPKWHAKHDPATSHLIAIPALVRVRVKR